LGGFRQIKELAVMDNVLHAFVKTILLFAVMMRVS
jgi:hypothetical protein